MTEKEIVKLREILGRIARRSEHRPDLKLIKSLAIQADDLVKESDSLPTVSMRDLYGELREMGLNSELADKIIEWSKTL